MIMVIFTLIFLSFLLHKALAKAPALSRQQKVRHFFATVTVGVMAAPYIDQLFFCVLHPAIALDRCYVVQGFSPAWLTLLLEICCVALAAIVWSAAASLAARKSKTRNLFLRVWPIMVVLILVQYVAIVSERATDRGLAVQLIFYLCGIGLFVGLGMVIDRHFRSARSDIIFMQHDENSQPA